MKTYTEPHAYSNYLTVSKSDKAWQIYCTCFGSSVITPGTEYPLQPKEHPEPYGIDWDRPGRGRVLQEFQIVYITKGRGSFYSGDRLFRITEGSVFFLLPGVPHWFCPDDDTGWNEYWIGFNGEYPEILVKRNFFTAERPVFTIGVHDDIVDDFYRLRQTAETGHPGFQHVSGAVIIGILAKIISYSRRLEQGDETENLINNARILMEENIYSSIRMEKLVASLDIDYTRFRKIFKKYTGLSPYHYFLQMKINAAKELLGNHELTIKEIAFKLGFENQYYFSRIFKHKTGTPPSEWQKRRNNEQQP